MQRVMHCAAVLLRGTSAALARPKACGAAHTDMLSAAACGACEACVTRGSTQARCMYGRCKACCAMCGVAVRLQDYWERFVACVDELAKKGQRTVFRLTLVNEWNNSGACVRCTQR